MRKLISLLIILFSINLYAVESIKVGAYNFPPFIIWENHKPDGLTVKLLEKFNKEQDKYKFELVETSSLRQYEDFKNNLFDMLVFESIDWGWKDYDLKSSKIFMNGGEVFVALKDGHTQSFFNDLNGKKIRGFKGYHYQFLNFQNDEQTLQKNNVFLTTSHEGNIEAVLLKEADMAIVTMEFLKTFFEKNPQTKDKIIVSTKYDQKYKHTILIRNNAKISLKEINQLLNKTRPSLNNLK